MKIFPIILVLTLYSFQLKTPEQLIKTSLQIIIRNELGNIEADANVRLFKSKSDYDKLENAATPTLKTDKNGKVTFKELEPIIYYINVEKENRNNFGGGEQTDSLEANRINKITIIIE